MVRDTGMGGITLEGRDVTFEREGELPVFLSHAGGGEPGNSIPSSVLVLESQLELLKKVIPGSEEYGCARDSVFPKGVGSSQGRPFSHI